MLKVMTVVGTRPEVIRLSSTLALLDELTDHVLVHTGQNYDPELNRMIFDDLGLRLPDDSLHVPTSSLGAVLGGVLAGVEAALVEHRPDALVVLGDTNSCIAALMARRNQVPVYHLEAGNRSFDENVPEEANRRMVDHVSDYNLAYTEHARRNLLAEGLHPARVVVTGSPMREVLDQQMERISGSTALGDLDVTADGYFLVSMHREENVDEPRRLGQLTSALNALADEYGLPVLVSLHPRTAGQLERGGHSLGPAVRAHKPFVFSDYVCLQRNARCVLSDSGTISEESMMLDFAAVTLRPRIERPEALDFGGMITSGIESDAISDAVRVTLHGRANGLRRSSPAEYQVHDFSRRVVNFIRSTASTHHEAWAIRKRSAVWR